jgi:NAD(P)-dependent dehydrogenase (short-subunit alcohol dehydrogenase family)
MTINTTNGGQPGVNSLLGRRPGHVNGRGRGHDGSECGADRVSRPERRHAVSYPASEEARYVTGSTLIVDGEALPLFKVPRDPWTYYAVMGSASR